MRIVLLFFCMLSFESLVNGQWLPTSKVTSACNYILEKDNRLFVSAYGGVFSSSDQGVNWKRVENSGKPIMHTKWPNSFKVDGKALFLCLEDNFYSSMDNGKTWSLMISDYVRGEFAANGLEVIAITGNANFRLKRTNDFGKNWVDITSKLPFDTIRFGDRLNFQKGVYFYHKSDSGEIFKSSDSGATWQTMAIPDKVIASNISDQTLWAVSESKIHFSKDNGNTWITKSTPFTVQETISARGDTLYAPTAYGTIYRSFDSGDSWTKLPLDLNLFWWGPYDKAVFISAAGILYAPSTFGLSYSKDKGNTWTPAIYEGFTGVGCYGVYPLENNVFANFGFSGVSSDQGNIWHGSFYMLSILDVANTPIGNYCISNDGLYRTFNLGRNWSKVQLDTGELLYSSMAYDGNKVYVFGEKGLYSTSDGLSWQLSTVKGISPKRIGQFDANAKKLFAIDYPKSDLYESVDQGANWTQIISNLSNFKNFNKVACFDQIIVASTFFDLFVSTDNGLNWRSIKNNLPYNFATPTILMYDKKLLITAKGLPVLLSNEAFTEWYEIDPTGINFTTDNYGMAIVEDQLYLAQGYDGLFKRNLNEILKVSTTDLPTDLPTLFPNPATQVLQLEVRDGATYEIYGIDGRSWVTKSKTSGAIDVSQLPTGTYILKITESQRTYSRKFVKE